MRSRIVDRAQEAFGLNGCKEVITLNLETMRLHEELDQLAQQIKKLEQRIDEVTPKSRYIAMLKPGEPLCWVLERRNE